MVPVASGRPSAARANALDLAERPRRGAGPGTPNVWGLSPSTWGRRSHSCGGRRAGSRRTRRAPPALSWWSSCGEPAGGDARSRVPAGQVAVGDRDTADIALAVLTGRRPAISRRRFRAVMTKRTVAGVDATSASAHLARSPITRARSSLLRRNVILPDQLRIPARLLALRDRGSRRFVTPKTT